MRTAIVIDARRLHALGVKPRPVFRPFVRPSASAGPGALSGTPARGPRRLRGDTKATIERENRKFMSADALRFIEGPSRTR